MIESFKLPNITPETLTGSIVSFNDEYGGLSLKSCTSLITGYQEGSGTPSPSNVRNLVSFNSATLTENGNTHLFTFGQSIYQGSIDCKRGVVVGTWGYFTDNGILPWIKEGDYNSYYTYNVVSNAKIRSLVYCNIQRSEEPPRYTGNPNAWISSSGRFEITLPEITSREAFLTLISNTPIQVAYELATPIEIPLGGINLLTQDVVNNIFCDTGDTTLEWLKVN